MARMITIAALLCAAATVPAAPALATPTDTAESGESVCKYVVSAERGAKPFKACMTKAQWAAKEAMDVKDANRIECRYEDVPGSKFKSRKICQPASAWAEDRRIHREQIEQIQMRVCVAGAGC